jgi:hypothetical protein
MLILECSQGCYGRTEGRTRYYIPSQLHWQGDKKHIILESNREIAKSTNRKFKMLLKIIIIRLHACVSWN